MNTPIFRRQSNKALVFLGVFAFCIIYATLRYVVFKGISPSNFPLYITNKIISWAGIALIAISYLKRTKKRSAGEIKSNDFTEWAGITGFTLIAMHIIISLAILTPSYYPKFYADDKMTFWAELSILMGILAFFTFSIPAVNSVTVIRASLQPDIWKSRQRIGYLGLMGTAAHTTFMGYSNWFDIQSWPGYMPPITLLATIIALIPLLLKPLKK